MNDNEPCSPNNCNICYEESDGYWWCPECKEEVIACTVTFQELHENCGCAVIWKENMMDDTEKWISDTFSFLMSIWMGKDFDKLRLARMKLDAFELYKSCPDEPKRQEIDGKGMVERYGWCGLLGVWVYFVPSLHDKRKNCPNFQDHCSWACSFQNCEHWKED